MIGCVMDVVAEYELVGNSEQMMTSLRMFLPKNYFLQFTRNIQAAGGSLKSQGYEHPPISKCILWFNHTACSECPVVSSLAARPSDPYPS